MGYRNIFFAFFCLIGLSLMALPKGAMAQQIPGSNPQITAADQCTNFSGAMQQAFDTSDPTKTGLLTDIYYFIVDVVADATQSMFEAFINNDSYQNAVYGAITLMITLYGVGFLIGVVQPSFQQVLVRLFKIGIIFALISPGGWNFFHMNVVKFFQDGTDDIINGVQEISTGIVAPAGASPFYALDRIAEFVIQPDTIIAIMGSITAGGPFGLPMGGLMILTMAAFIGMLLKALQVYAIAFVARALVLGLAPIFFIFLLFDRTKNMFIAWLNALINLSLRPILLFTFMSFFIVLMEGAAKDVLGAELCWTKFQNISGSVNSMAFWRYRDKNPPHNVITGDMDYQGSLECLLSPANSVVGGCQPFPVDILDLLTFLILIYIAKRFTDVVERIASELSNAMVGLDSSGKLEQILHSKQQASGGGFTANVHQGNPASTKQTSVKRG